ncbi:hypothetical protein TrVE_jg11016 [Triparma verrucosa]|uniref:2Fe-2S ferredoxin-type domain-containing protein n=2 Tax=Triparma TaxID=722752 RepID=A0A9W7BZF6_9STRA|nr:hypothetical protein TrST_g1334 [Triparma strigata]GMI13199.1 hypothetical protein TrVE_jg11016 [Triparma verrucosa]
MNFFSSVTLIIFLTSTLGLVLQSSSFTFQPLSPPLTSSLTSSNPSLLRPPTALFILGGKPKPKLKEAKWEDVDRTLLKEKAGTTQVGTIPVTFTQGSETRSTMALPGEKISEVASKADQFIKYKCKKGECGTCEVKVDGQWVRSCVTKIPATAESYEVDVRPSMVPKSKAASGFFSAASFVDGFQNNVLGMVGLVTEGAKEDDNFEHRMTEEERIKEIVRRKKEEREMKERRP